MIFRPKRHRIIAGMIISIIFLGGILGWHLRDEDARITAWQSPIVQFGIHTFRSLRKIADLPYIVYQLRSDDLPTYELTIDPKDIVAMNALLPDDAIKGRLLDDNKLKVKATFRAGSYQARIDIRYRGRGPNHWNSLKKSYQIDFPDENPFAGNTQLKFNIPEDRGYAVEPLNFYRAKKLGLFAPEPWFAKLRLNGQDIGVYFVLPHWTPEFVEKNKRPEPSNIFGIKDLPRLETIERNFFRPENIDFWEDYTKDVISDADREALKNFLSVVSYAPDDVFERTLPALVEMDSLYDWLILNTLAASTHQNVNVNIILLRDSSTGRFQPIPWDTQLFSYEPLNVSYHPLIGRTLAIPAFRKEFLKRLQTYVTGNDISDDLAFYDSIAETLRVPLYKDNAKAPLSWSTGRALSSSRDMIENNARAIKKAFDTNETETLLQGSFPTPETAPYQAGAILNAAALTRETFLRQQSIFYRTAPDTFSIGPGTVVLPKTVILPSHTKLIVQPGTHLLMGSKASLILWDNIKLEGTKNQPITVHGLSQEPWGSILVIGDQTGTSTLRFASIAGGSGVHEYGITATGMVAFHNENGEVTDSTFENTFDDDALNIKHGRSYITRNIFHSTFGDAIDLDTAPGIVENNFFGDFGYLASKGKGPNGDGIDISFTKAIIRNNIIRDCGDKGISIGEASEPFIDTNLIIGCAIGISVKDLSRPIIENTYLIKNNIGIEAKQKKTYFGGGHGTVRNSKLWSNKRQTDIDEFSSLDINVNVEIKDTAKASIIPPNLPANFREPILQALSR